MNYLDEQLWALNSQEIDNAFRRTGIDDGNVQKHNIYVKLYCNDSFGVPLKN